MKVEDKLMRILATMENGDVSDFHYTASPSSFINWNKLSENANILNVVVFEESYKLIIYSQVITIYDYLNSSIWR